MKFLLDQNTDARLLVYLKQLSHDATQIRRTYPENIPDPDVLALAYQEKRILITGDRDFGEWVFRFKRPHAGVISFGLARMRPLI
jgi:predicted nuclease of predicted toxin-antitoxin system